MKPIDCTTAREAMFNGTFETEGPNTDPLLVQHWKTCPACAQLRCELETVGNVLSNALEGRGPARDFESAVWSRIRSEAPATHASAGNHPAWTRPLRRRSLHPRMVCDVIGAAGVALAAVAMAGDLLEIAVPSAGTLLHHALSGPTTVVALAAAAAVAILLPLRLRPGGRAAA